MSQADELLNSVSSSQKSARTVDPDTEEHIVIGNDRIITVPDSLKKIAVQYDHNMETVTFDCPRYWDGHDMLNMKVYINYMRSDRALGMYLADNVREDEFDDKIMHFDWTITSNATGAKGKLEFLVCIKKTDENGYEENHWNSELNEDMIVSEGLEVEDPIIEDNDDIITQLLTRMDFVESIATVEAMQGYVEEYLNDGTIVKEHVFSYMEQTDPTTPEMMLNYVQHYLDNNPPLFVIGPDKPGVKCLWFNTAPPFGEDEPSEEDSNIAVSLTSDKTDSAYLDVETNKKPVYDFTII